jgi:DNA repair protein RadC
MPKKTIGQAMRKLPSKKKDPPEKNNFVPIYRISMVRDRQVKFEAGHTENSIKAHVLAKKLIEQYGQPDREQFLVILLNTENKTIGINTVSVGTIQTAIVFPREVLKPAILGNAAALILCHNHPGGQLRPSQGDMEVTRKIVFAAHIMGIRVHEHLIVSMDSDDYFSMADQGMINDFYKDARMIGW